MNKKISTKVACSLFFAILFICLFNSATISQPTVIVEESHADLLLLDNSYEWNMMSLANELTSNGYAVSGLEVPITLSALSSCNVFCIIEPMMSFSQSEIDALKSYVNNGGGLLIAVNYGVNADGSSTSWATACQQISNAFGFTLDNNCPTDATHNVYSYPYWITFDATTFNLHPIMRGISSVQSYRSTTLTGPVGSSLLFNTYSTTLPADKAEAVVTDYGLGEIMVCGGDLYFANSVQNRHIGSQIVDMLGINAADNRRFAYQAITYLAGAQCKPLANISSPKESQTVYGSVNITGTACDANIDYYKVEYANASSPDTYNTISTIKDSCVMGNLASWDTSSIDEGSYTIKLTVHKSSGLEASCSADVSVKHLNECTSIPQAKALKDGTLVKLSDMVATTGSSDFNGCYYIEDKNRSSALKVVGDNSSITRGQTISVVGFIDTACGERVINVLSNN